MLTQNLFQNETLVNLATAQIDRNSRVARLFADATTKTVVGSVERGSQLATSITNEVAEMFAASTEAAAELARTALAPFSAGESVKVAVNAKKKD